MTEVFVKKVNEIYQYIEIAGHSKFAIYGQDIVCSAISSIVFGTLNALVKYQLAESRIIIESAFIRIELQKSDDIQLIADVMLVQLQTIQESYPDYIRIEIN